MDHQTTMQKIIEWRKKNKIHTWKNAKLLIKSYGRIQRFHNGDISADMKILAYPSEVKEVREFFDTNYPEQYRQLAWYKLTNKGKETVLELVKDLDLNESELNSFIFTL